MRYVKDKEGRFQLNIWRQPITVDKIIPSNSLAASFERKFLHIWSKKKLVLFIESSR